MAHTVYRVRQIPSKWRYEDLEEELRTEYKLGVTIHSFASHNQKRCNMNVAIVSFDGVTEKLRQNDNGSWHPLIKSARTGAKGVVLDLDINFDGFTPISDVETDQDHNIDFIVVHGWGSHAYGGFCYKGDGARTSWLHKVANEFSELRIWFYGYQSSLNDERIMSSIDTWANGFRHSLCGLRQSEEKSRPMIILSHSLGGIIVQKAIVGMKLCEDRSPDLLSIYGLLQFGVPNRGMNIDALVCMVKDKPSRHVLEHLQPHVGHGRRQKDHEEFCNSFDCQGSEVRYFFETRKSPTVIWDKVTKKWGMNGEPACAVSESEACHLRPKEVHAQVSVPMDYNHSEMVKLRPGDEDGYSKIRQVIERFVEKAPSVIQLRFKDNPRNQNHNTAGDKNTEPVHDMEHQSTQDCLKSLTCNNVKRDITPPYNNTCQWIQTNPKYQGWRRRLSGLLWMRGKPGSGKSTVMSYIQRNNDWKDPTENSSTAFYFFSGQGTSFQRSQIGLLQSLLHQIVSTVPSQLRRVEQVYEEKKRSGGNLELQWSLFELQDLFRQMFAFPDTPPIRLYIDALDEANEDSPSEVLFFFQSILENPATRLSICFTCRHFPNLGFHDPGLDIDVEQENTDDIITYIDHFLKSNSQSGGNNDWIVKEIAKKSNNIFQWVVMITSKVSKLQRSGSSEQSILNFLNSPNLDLGKLYRGTLEKIEPSDRPESLRLLQWMCFSLRSLTVDEIRYAMAINSTLPNTKHHRWEDSPTYIETMKARSRIHYLSGGLAELVPFCEFDSSTQQNVSAIEGVRLIHQSVLDFLLSEGLEFLSGKTFLSEQGHDFLAKSCLNYLTRVDVLRLSIKRSFVSFEGYTPKGCFHDKELIHKNSDPAKNLYICPDCTDLEPTNSRRSNLLQEFPLLGYAVDGLLRHAMLSEPEFDQTDLHKRLQNPLDIWGYINLLRSTLDSSKVDLSQTFFHVAANIGWSEAFVRNFNHSTPLDYLKQWNTENMYGQTPIWIAAAKGHVDVLKTIPLQARSICLNQTDKKGISVLVSALRGRHDDVIAFLLDGDAIDVNQRYSNGKTPLLDCAERGYAEGLERILGHPHLDINLQDPNGKTPLMICAEKGYQTGLQKILCHKNLNINFQDFEGKTALHIAVHCQNIEAVEGLMGCDLMMPADRFIQDHTGSTPLHVAVRDRNFEMVQTLLTYHTGDYNAAKVVYPGTHGGGLDYQDNCGNTAILIAMDDPPDYDIAHILADDHGADWRIENNNGYNVYDLAREKGEQDIIEMLEDTQITGTSPPPETTPSPETTPPHDGYTHTLGMEGLELDPTEAMPRDFMDLDGIPDIRGRKRQFEDILGMSEAQGHRNKSLRRS